MSRVDRLYDDIYEDIINTIETGVRNRDIMFEELAYAGRGNRNDYNTKLMETLASNAEKLYYFFTDDYYKDRDEKYCYNEAMRIAVDYGLAYICDRSTAIRRDLSDNDLDWIDTTLDNWRKLSHEMDRFSGRSQRRAEEYSRRSGYSSDRSSRYESRYNNSRYNNRNTESRSSSRVFNDNSSNTSNRDQPTASSSRAANTKYTTMAEQRQQDRNKRMQDASYRNQRTPSGNTTNPRRNPGYPEEEIYFRTWAETLIYPKRPGNEEPPFYNPFTQRLQVTLDKDGFLEYRILEVKNMNPADHEKIIVSLSKRYRATELKPASDKSVRYVIDGVELDTMAIENDTVDKVIEEMIERKEAPAGAGFMDLTEEQRRAVLTESTKRNQEERERMRAAARRKLIEQGAVPEAKEKEVEILRIEDTKDVSSIQQGVADIIAEYGQDTHTAEGKLKGYVAEYVTLTPLTKCESPIQQETLSDLLAGLSKSNNTVQSIYSSLSDRSIPLPVFTRLNARATKAINYAIHHLAKIPSLVIDDFVDDTPDLAEWLKSQIDKGHLDADRSSAINKYVCGYVARIVRPNLEMLRKYYPTHTEQQLEVMKLNTIFESRKGKLTYIPVLSSELGLLQEVNDINRMDSKFLNALISPNAVPDDIVITADGKYYSITYSTQDRMVLQDITIY